MLGVVDSKRLRDLTKISGTKRLKFATYAKSAIEKIVEDLDRWQRDFDPSWFFLSRMAVPMIDEELSEKRAAESKGVSTVIQLRQAHRMNESSGSGGPQSVFLQSGYEVLERKPLPLCSAYTGRSSEELLIIDHVPIRDPSNPKDIERKAKDVRDLARILSAADSERFGLLPCRGVIKVIESKLTGFDLIFSIPQVVQQTNPVSLRSILSDQSFECSLNDRVALASSLARSIVFLHSSSFVHKNVSPENIILCRSSSEILGPPFLVGFDQFRHADARTQMIGDSLWEKNLYRHPERQGLHPQEEYCMQHDIYSLGVCLLENCLWNSFVLYSDQSDTKSPGQFSPIEGLVQSRDQRRAATQIKQILVELASSKLPLVMGIIYAEVFVSCLTCLDKNNDRFGDEWEFQDEDGIQVGVRYIEKILFEIEKIVV